MSFANLKILNASILRPYTRQNGVYGIKPKIAIIGNGGATEQDEEEMLKADVVVRFNNYATREKISHPKERFRCDVLFTTTDLHSNGAMPKDVVIGIPSPFKQHQVLKNLPKWYPNASYWMVNPYFNYLLCEELGLNSDGSKHPLPSIGFTALWHMHDWYADFYIGGFNWYYDKVMDTIQNRRITMENLPSNFNHFYMKELKWIIEKLCPKKNILFSDACQEILDRVKKAL